MEYFLLGPLPLNVSLFPRDAFSHTPVKLILGPWLIRPEFQSVRPFIDDSMLAVHRHIKYTFGLLEFKVLQIPLLSISLMVYSFQTMKHSPVKDMIICSDEIPTSLELDNCRVISGSCSPKRRWFVWSEILDQGFGFSTLCGHAL